MARRLLGVDVTSAAIIIAWFGFTLWAAYSVFHDNNVHIYAENRLIENVQACILVIASIVYFATAALDKSSEKLIIMFCSLLCLTFFLREVDVEDFDIPYALIFIGSGAGRNTILTAAFVAIFIYTGLKHTHYKKAAVEFAKSRPGWLLMAGGVFLLIGDFFEKNDTILHHSVFFEEINELFGYVLILLSSIAAKTFPEKC